VADRAAATWERDQRHIAHHGWVTSVAGAREVRIDVLPGSALPATLERIGYRLRREEPGQRVLAHAIVEEFTRNKDGSLALLSPGSTLPIERRMTHAGISPVERFSFDLP
jgi:hypothetical protein